MKSLLYIVGGTFAIKLYFPWKKIKKSAIIIKNMNNIRGKNGDKKVKTKDETSYMGNNYCNVFRDDNWWNIKYEIIGHKRVYCI